ncbi:MAG: putative Ig domain-containing protein, partial [Verrucomicrobia bacterium]|nr:putative Ig domain-containing protein [Verrucomicrobiota bacterium]
MARLDVYVAVGFSEPPQDTAVIVGSTAVLNGIASGSGPLSYQWKRSGTNLVDGERVDGAKSSALTIMATRTNDDGNYTVSVANPASGPTNAVVRLMVLVPATFTSVTNLVGRQGAFLSFTNKATSNYPISYGADGLPAELSLDSATGVISGIPQVTGVYNVILYATVAALTPSVTTTGQLAITLTTGVPGITSARAAGGKQGLAFSYTITASNNPVSFSASVLPTGLSFNPANGVISGPPIVSGTFPITIGVANQYGSDSRMLTLVITSSVPVITSTPSATGTENQAGFTYTIQASDNPTQFGASGLPLGLTLNTNTGAITGTPLYGGFFTVPIWAINAWGTGTTNLILNLDYATLGGLAVTDVTHTWSKPYVLDFSFSLRDGDDPSTNSPVVRPPIQLQVLCMEDGVPIGSENPYILENADKKQFKGMLVLDYTYSMLAAPGAIDAMQGAAKLLINEEPAHALFGIYEFHAEYVTPQMVTTNPATTNG